MEIRALGPLEADHDGQVLNLGGAQQRLVLAVLLCRVNEAVSTDRIVDEVWPYDPPRTAHRTVQAYISTLRHVLEPRRAGTLVATRPGYEINLDEDSHDVLRFERLLRVGRAQAISDPADAIATLREADALWRGDAYADIGGAPALTAEVHRLESLRLGGIEVRVDAELALAGHRSLVPELEDLIDRYPLREGLRGQLMTALYRSGRQAEALRVYQQTRHVLGEELGIEPSSELQRLQGLILTHDSSIEASPSMASPTMVPGVAYTETFDGLRIAYYAFGSGDRDLIFVPGWISNIETIWDHPLPARFLIRLSSMSRLICFDKRGTGLSDRVLEGDLPDVKTRADDVRAVLDAVGSEKAVLFGVSVGGPMCATFAATHPERTEGLIMYGSYAARIRAEGYPWAPSIEARERWLSYVEKAWGSEVDLRTLAPSMVGDAEFTAFWSRYLRSGASPGAATMLGRMNTGVDIRDIVSDIEAPTLILHRTGDLDAPVEGGRWLAEHIPNARLVEFDGRDHLPQVDSDEIMDAIEEFLAQL